MLDIYLYTIYFIVGSIIGSFSNMLIYRYIHGETIWKEQRSYCPSCRKVLKWYHLIPIFSYLFLKGKCGYCEKGISSRYLYLELFSAILFVFIMHNVPFSIDNIIFYFVILFFLIPLFYIDVMIHLVYDGYLKFLILLTALMLFINDYYYSFNLHLELPTFKVAIISFFAVYILMIFFNKIVGLLFYGDYRVDAVGMGDVKLLGWMVMIVGSFTDVLLIFFLSSIITIFLDIAYKIIFHQYYVKKKSEYKLNFTIEDSYNKKNQFKIYLSELINPTLYNHFIDTKILPHHFFVEEVNNAESIVTLRCGKMILNLEVDTETLNRLNKDKKNAGFDFYAILNIHFDNDGNVYKYTYGGLSDYELHLQSIMRNKAFGSSGVPFFPGLIFGFLVYLIFSDQIFSFVFDLFISIK